MALGGPSDPTFVRYVDSRRSRRSTLRAWACEEACHRRVVCSAVVFDREGMERCLAEGPAAALYSDP